MKIALLNAGKTRSVLKRLIKDYDDIQIAVAWGYNGKLADLLMENKGKFRSVTFGLNGFATSPDLVERLIGTKNAFIAKADTGIFHPKLYLFRGGGIAQAIVGSANFTKGGLDRNHEACVHIEGPADADIFKQIQRELSGYDVIKQRVTQTLADSYRRQYDAARKQRGLRDPILPDDKNGGRGLTSPLAMMSWQDFAATAKLDDRVRGAVLAMLATRVSERSVCPSEVARAIAPGSKWHSAMPAVHAAVDVLVAEKLVQLRWKGEPLAIRKGPYRITKPIKN